MFKEHRGADLLVRCLEAADVRYVFGVPGEENLDLVDALRESPIRFITTRHEQAAAFMADVYGRLTGHVGVCTATLGPGATNLITGIADAYLDRAPMIAIAGQGATHRLHKESHQIIDLARLFESVSKYSARINEADAIAEIVAAALAEACASKPGPAFIELPENIAAEAVDRKTPIDPPPATLPIAPQAAIQAAAKTLQGAQKPLVLIGNGAVRAGAADQVAEFVDACSAAFTTTFMAKGTVSDEHPRRLATIGLSENEHTTCGFDQADLVIAIGYDLVEYDPGQWHRDPRQPVLHIDVAPAEVDRNYAPALSVVGDIKDSLARLTAALASVAHKPADDWAMALRDSIRRYESDLATSDAFPVKPQRLLHDLRQVMDRDDILISDVGAHKVWIAHRWHSLSPNTCIISNGFAAMGIGLPGAIAAKLAFPDRTVVTATGDAGFMMNVQELETALRLDLAIVVLVWNDSGYGLIEWHQDRRFGYSNDVAFGNPDFVALAQSFGAQGFRVESADDLVPTLRQAADCGTVAVVDCPVDYTENMRLTERLGRLTCMN
jgi:acetolactate synthase I/II/III large subunit